MQFIQSVPIAEVLDTEGSTENFFLGSMPQARLDQMASVPRSWTLTSKAALAKV